MMKTDLASDESVGPAYCKKYEDQQNPRNKFQFISKMFSSKMKPKKVIRVRSPQLKRVHQLKKHSPQRQDKDLFVVDEVMYTSEPEDVQSVVRSHPQYNVLVIESTAQNNVATCSFHSENDFHGTAQESNQDCSEKDKMFEDIRQNNTYFEVVTVEDRGTDPWETVHSKVFEDKSTDAMLPLECKLSSCGKEKENLSNVLQDKNKAINSCLDEGHLLLEDIEKLKKHLSSCGKISEVFSTHLKQTLETPSEFVHLGRTCLMELGKQIVSVQKQIDADVQKLKNELHMTKKERTEKEGKIKNLERKLETQLAKINQEGQDSTQLLAKVGKLQDSLEMGKRLLKDAEKSFKTRIEKLESDLLSQKQSNSKSTQALNEKTHQITQLEANIAKLENSLEISKQQMKDFHFSYKTKIAKLETEHTNKVASLCENQTLTNKQLSQALDQSTKYVTQIQETKKENTSLLASNKSIHEKMAMLERELSKAQERCSAAERKLSRETQEVLALRAQVDRLEALKEEEVLSVDGDIWCQIMYQQDQWIMDDLRVSLQEKEINLESLRAQGDCALKDFEKLQSELQQRRQQFNELKDVFLDFEKKRDSVVREQRDFYSKMMLLSRRTIPRDRFYRNLIEECQLKTCRIEELEKTLKKTDKAIEETQKISEAQLKAMQAEMKFTAEKLYEFENQIRIKEMQLQDVIRVFEQEKKNKTTAEEAMNTYKILLEDSKKENTELRNKLNYLEDLEKNRTNVLKVTEELATETQKRQDTEGKLKILEKDFQEMKKQLITKDENFSPRSENCTANNNKIMEPLKLKIKDLTEDKKYMERILMESQRSKELLQKDKEELCKKLRYAVRVMVESKGTQEEMELKLDQRMQTIHELEKSQTKTEDRLDDLKEVLHDMKQAIELLHQDRAELRDKLSNHTHCKAEMAVNHELKLLQRDKTITEEQHSREKELLLHRLRENEETMKEQHRHLRAFQEQLDNLNAQLREAKGQLAAERHNHTQQLLTIQADKKKMELYIQELEGRLAFETRLRMQTSDTMVSSPNYLNSSDSYEPPNRDYNKHYHRK